MKYLRTILGAFLAAALVSGCALFRRPAVPDSEGALEYDEYTTVTETGSHIPKKIRKGELTDGSQNIEKVDGSALIDLQRDQTLRRMRAPGG